MENSRGNSTASTPHNDASFKFLSDHELYGIYRASSKFLTNQLNRYRMAVAKHHSSFSPTSLAGG